MTKRKLLLPIFICAMLLSFVLGLTMVFSNNYRKANAMISLDNTWQDKTGWVSSVDYLSISHTGYGGDGLLTHDANLLWSNTTYDSGIDSLSVSAKSSAQGNLAWGILLEFSAGNWIIAWVEWETFDGKLIFSKFVVAEMYGTGTAYAVKADFWTYQDWFVNGFNATRTLDSTKDVTIHFTKSNSDFTFYLNGITVGTISNFENGAQPVKKIGLTSIAKNNEIITFDAVAPKKSATALDKTWNINPTWTADANGITSNATSTAAITSINAMAITPVSDYGTKYSISTTAKATVTPTGVVAYSVVPFIKDSSNYVMCWVEFDTLPTIGDGWLRNEYTYGITKFVFNVYVDGVQIIPTEEKTHWTDNQFWFEEHSYETTSGDIVTIDFDGKITSDERQKLQGYDPTVAKTLRIDRNAGKYVVYYDGIKLFEHTITNFVDDAPKFIGVSASGTSVNFSGVAKQTVYTVTQQLNGVTKDTEECLPGTVIELNDSIAKNDFGTDNMFAWKVGDTYTDGKTYSHTVDADVTISALAIFGNMSEITAYEDSNYSRLRLRFDTSVNTTDQANLSAMGASFEYKTTLAKTKSYGGMYTYDSIKGKTTEGETRFEVVGALSDGKFYAQYKMPNYEIASSFTAISTVTVSIGGKTYTHDYSSGSVNAYTIFQNATASTVTNGNDADTLKALCETIYNITDEDNTKTGSLPIESLNDINALYINGGRVFVVVNGYYLNDPSYEFSYENGTLSWKPKA